MMKAEEILRDCVRRGRTEPKRARYAQRVVLLCEELAGRFKAGKVNLPLLTEAAWLHNVAEDYNDGGHHRPEVIKAVISGREPDGGLDDVTAIISAYRGKLFMPEKYPLESAILRMCNRIDKVNKAQEKSGAKKIGKKTEKAKEKCEKNLKRIQDSRLLEDGDFQIIRRFCADKIKALEEKP